MQIFPKKKITELSGIVIILVDHFNKFSFSFMFHLDESAGRKYFKFRLWSIFVCCLNMYQYNNNIKQLTYDWFAIPSCL